ncbi:MAG: GAF domain-containing sensor histidine kinase [Bacteroidota bacterium]
MNSSTVPSLESNRSSLWVMFARIVQVVIVCMAIGLFFISLPINYERRSEVCSSEPCSQDLLNPASIQALNRIGMTAASYAGMTVSFDLLVAAVFTISGIVIFVRKPNDLFTIFVTIMLVIFGTATFTGSLAGISSAYPRFGWLVAAITLFGNCAFLGFFYLFPNGHFVPKWTAGILLAWFLFQLPRYFFPNAPFNLQNNQSIYNLLFTLGILSGAAAQVHRYLHVSNAVERQQTKWVLYGLVIGVGGFIGVRTLHLLLPDSGGSDLPISLVLNIAAIFFMLLIPVSITIAVLKYRLWDINPIINRTLVYGALSALTMAFYILAVGFFANYFQQQNINLLISFLATGVVAVLFEPLRKWLQRGVNRLMYGERDDPATVLHRLSQRLDSALAPDSVLQTIVETLVQTLRLPYAAISVFSAQEAPSVIASLGQPASELIALPLRYQTEPIGELILSPRAAGESFTTADMNLLHLIAGQAGIAVHNLRLTRDLQRSRENIVTAREEERRRLRRDLHDGIGPTLASLSQRLDTAADLVQSDPEASIALLKALKGQVKNTVSEIRQLVYALRPPVLDEFGLVTALREHVAQYAGPNGIEIAFDITDPLPPLPAAVEVAAYRIVLEAFTNIINHAEATACQIRIKAGQDCLELEVSDNGKGLAADVRSGVGLSSMRERAMELGGEFDVQSNPAGGLRVLARLPMGKG